ncbi:MAG TPA: hypothetical protein VFN64_04870 [Burkholderiaceae bacterium]|nr:hypothetical protein [Burkholderiaceae bacterium]
MSARFASTLSVCAVCGMVAPGRSGWFCQCSGVGVDVWQGVAVCPCTRCTDLLAAAGFRVVHGADGISRAVAAGAEAPSELPRRRAIRVKR